MNASNLDLNDDLSDLLGSPRKPQPIEPPASYKPMDYTEPCKKCRGSGRFVGWSGRSFGQCFACKGAGKFTFKTSQESRAQAKTTRTNKKIDTVSANIDGFKSAQPAIYAWIETSMGSFPFALAMFEAVGKYGSLTEKQLAACQKCIDARTKSQADQVAREAAAPVISITAIEKAFDAARAAGKTHKLHLDLDTFDFKPAKATGKNPGAIYVCEAGEYLGKVVAGKFHASRECGDERRERILAAAADPHAAAIAFGKRTGTCSCCRRTLTDPNSIAAGIGPICATKHGW